MDLRVVCDSVFQERGMNWLWCIVFHYAVMNGLEC